MALTVVITGANRGIGLSFCRHYRQKDCIVYGVCRQSSAALEEVADVVINNIDVSHEQDYQVLFSKLAGVSIDILINNAGIFIREDLGKIDFDTIAQQFQVNAIAALRVTEGLMENLGEGSKVAMITSRMGSVADNGSGSYYGYRMSKAALNAAAKSLAIDLQPRGVAVGIYHPGFVSTDMVGGHGEVTPDQAVESLTNRIEELDMTNTGSFWHANGEMLPW